MARRTKEEANQTRALLLDAAEHLFLQKGVKSTSLQDIADAAGLTRGAVYWHFVDKYDLFAAMNERVKSPMDARFEEAAVAENPMQALKDLSILVLKNLAKDEHLQRVFSISLFKCESVDTLQSAHSPRARRDEVVARMEKTFRRARSAGQLKNGVTPANAAIALHAFMLGLFSDYLRNRDAFDIATRATALIELFFASVEA